MTIEEYFLYAGSTIAILFVMGWVIFREERGFDRLLLSAFVSAVGGALWFWGGVIYAAIHFGSRHW